MLTYGRNSLARWSDAIAGAFVIYLIATGKAGFDVVQSGFAANGYEAHSPGGYSLFAALVCEIVMTCAFLIVILGGATHGRALWDLPVLPSVLRLNRVRLLRINYLPKPLDLPLLLYIACQSLVHATQHRGNRGCVSP